MGSESDLAVMMQAAEVLRDLGVEHEVTIVSAHRTPHRMFDYSESAEKRGLKVIIAGAGGAAHLPGMVVALTLLPVVGVPILSTNSMQGLDSLLSIVQMPAGTPVATVAVNGSKNAGILAAQIIGLFDDRIKNNIFFYKRAIKEKVEKSIQQIECHGHAHLLKKK
jgi:5-(carboxyamino)imidazole ribonucleotide mutase